MASGHLRAPHKQAEQMAAPTSAAAPSKNPLPTGSRPQMANTGGSGHVATTVSLAPIPDIRPRMSGIDLLTSGLPPSPDVGDGLS